MRRNWVNELSKLFPIALMFTRLLAIRQPRDQPLIRLQENLML